jgi:hypothetical protein
MAETSVTCWTVVGLGCDTPQFEILVAFARSLSARFGVSPIEGGF